MKQETPCAAVMLEWLHETESCAGRSHRTITHLEGFNMFSIAPYSGSPFFCHVGQSVPPPHFCAHMLHTVIKRNDQNEAQAELTSAVAAVCLKVYTGPQHGAATSSPGAIEGEFKNAMPGAKFFTSLASMMPSLLESLIAVRFPLWELEKKTVPSNWLITWWLWANLETKVAHIP